MKKFEKRQLKILVDRLNNFLVYLLAFFKGVYMAIPNGISRLVKSNSIDPEIQNLTALEIAIKHAENYYQASSVQIYHGEIARPKLAGTSILVRQDGHTPGCILPDLYRDTLALKNILPSLSRENKRRVKKIVKGNLAALKSCGYQQESFSIRIQKVLSRVRFF